MPTLEAREMFMSADLHFSEPEYTQEIAFSSLNHPHSIFLEMF
jgi:hypothetical protein